MMKKVGGDEGLGVVVDEKGLGGMKGRGKEKKWSVWRDRGVVVDGGGKRGEENVGLVVLMVERVMGV